MPLKAIQAENGDTLTIQHLTQAVPDATQARFRYLQPSDREPDPKLPGHEAPPKVDQLQQLPPGQAIGDDRQGRGGLSGASFNEGTEHSLTRVLIEPRAEQAQGVDESVDA